MKKQSPKPLREELVKDPSNQNLNYLPSSCTMETHLFNFKKLPQPIFYQKISAHKTQN